MNTIATGTTADLTKQGIIVSGLSRGQASRIKGLALKASQRMIDFREAFRSRGRSENFSQSGLEVLFDYLEELSSADIDEPMRLDVIALCCKYSEDTPEDIADYYGIDLPEREEWMDDDDYSEEVRDAVLDYLFVNTSVCGVTDSGTIVYACF